MDPASLDPRLRDAGEDSIVVHDPTQDGDGDGDGDADAAASDSLSDSSHDSPAPEQPLQSLTTATDTATTTTTPIYTPQTPASNTVLPLPDGHPASIAISIAPAPTPTSAAAAETPHDPNDPKRPRACEACRGLKVKCEPDLLHPDGPCKRCAKAGRECHVTQPTRKRQKKTDSRVAELEKKIDALTASLQASRGTGGAATLPPPPPPPPPPSTTTPHPHPHQHQHQHQHPHQHQHQHPHQHPHPHPYSHRPSEADNAKTRIAKQWGPPAMPPLSNGSKEDRTVLAGQKRKFTEAADPDLDAHDGLNAPRMSNAIRQSDIIDRGVITADEASVYFQRYTDRMATHLPAVVFPPGTTAAQIRETRPILFLSIMSVASSETPGTQRQLVKELMHIFADSIIVHGQKSLELVQAIMISVIWYFPPEHFEELKFYQLVHLAAVMAIDIGLGRRKNSPKSRLIPYTWRDHPFRKHPLPDPATMESRRAWLAVYFLASNVAMALHRPNLVRWQSFMTECMDILESSPEAAPTDRYLCHLVWTHRLAEEVGIQFSMDDPSVFVNITENKVQYALRGFERDLAKYSEGIPKEDKQPSLLLSFSVMNLYMHEIALQTNDEYTVANPEALRDPIPGLADSLTAAHISALSSCLTAIDGIFDTFLSLDVSTIRCLPIFNFVRVAYAVVVLIKIYFSASSPNAELGKVINKDNMKVAEYIDRLLEKFRETAAQDKSRPAGKFLVVLVMVRGWFHQQGQSQGQSRTQADQNIDPTLKRPQVPQPNPATSSSNSRDNVPQPKTSHDQQHRYQPPPPNRKQPDYNPANTPLQLLSEVATGNGPSRNSQNNRAPAAPNLNTSAYPSWLGSGMQLPYMYDPNAGLPTSATSANGTVGSAGQPLIPWPNGPFGGDMDYMSMGDGFEQAMGLTLTGFGGGSPGDSVSYENSLRMMAQGDTNFMGVADEFAGNAGHVFGF
ncbi:putative fungal specific transcription protein [Rosellinia necatrix]|uniref:Putative fungal specific transcription protein n=1 Tax=Rosellinia necatrix TaxID=77044 RepID=A0A1W2TSH3_ROSNE|nr:putative fungal specific transcription protein [Rosellinia necatrix]